MYRFGPFDLDVNERRLLRDGELVPLLGKAFDTLVVLVEGAGRLQTQEAMMERLWPDAVVDQNNLQQNISLVRRALGKVEGVAIETVRGQGYRLLAEVALAERPLRAEAKIEARTRHTQRTHFCRSKDGARLAYARLGEGPPFVKVANWLSHVELDWEGPVWGHWLARLSRDHTFIRYDARGNGLSDWHPPTLRFADFIDDLGAVLDAAGVRRAPLLGISQGAAVAVSYAAQHPERVSALILMGGCARGWRVKDNAKLTERFEALMVLMRQGWGGQHPAFRQIFTSSFFPTASREQADWFNELQRQTTSPENAANILSALGDVDVRSSLSRVRVPTLVVHSRGDAIVPMKDGIELAAGIDGARFVPLESDNHLLLEHEPAWARFVHELDVFLGELASE